MTGIGMFSGEEARAEVADSDDSEDTEGDDCS